MKTLATAACIAALLASSAGGARSLDFAGRIWDIKSSDGDPAGPGPNVFTDARKAVFVDDQGALHLTIAYRHYRWESTEIVSRESLGYGTYRFDIAASANAIADNAVFGLFTYDLDPAQANREIDIELSRWGDGRTDNIQCSVQPADDRPDHYGRFASGEGRQGWIMEFSWAPGVFDCTVTDKASNHIIGHTHLTAGVPTPGSEKTRINLWQFRGKEPSGFVPSEVVVRNFTFTPR
jgi:hypothetical protein